MWWTINGRNSTRIMAISQIINITIAAYHGFRSTFIFDSQSDLVMQFLGLLFLYLWMLMIY
jgi:hypothetical protein